jgi:predicted RNase H-like nuclease (RuvC/YqgF family)
MEIKEFQTRISILQRELDDKNREIEQVTRERQLISETTERVKLRSSDIKEQTHEIQILNERYRKALKDKINVYDELVSAVKQLATRNSDFMQNEVEICRLMNIISIT